MSRESLVEKRIDYVDVDGYQLQGYLVYPKSAEVANTKLPAVTVHHAFEGITEFEEKKAKNLAELGYVAFAADVYGKGVKGNTREECFALLTEIRKHRRTKLKNRLMAAINLVANLPYVDEKRIASIGFCFGGSCCLDLARYNAPVKAVVSFHGSFLPLDPVDELPEQEKLPITPSITICHGDADPHVPKNTVDALIEELRHRQADFQFISYSKAQHAFTEPKHKDSSFPGVKYDEKADNRSWAVTISFLDEVLHGKINYFLN